jgi:hypothetical protein
MSWLIEFAAAAGKTDTLGTSCMICGLPRDQESSRRPTDAND